MKRLTFGQNLKRLRNQKNMTQEELGNLFNLSKATMSGYELGTKRPSIDVLEGLSDFFNVSTDHLLGRSGTAYISNKKIGIKKVTPPELKYLPIIGTVKAGPNGIAFEDFQGMEWINKNTVQGGEYFWLRVKGDSMINDGIVEGSLVLVRKQEDIESGEIAVVVINGDEGTVKKVIKKDGTITLQPSNNKYLPQIFSGNELDDLHIIGKVKLARVDIE